MTPGKPTYEELLARIDALERRDRGASSAEPDSTLQQQLEAYQHRIRALQVSEQRYLTLIEHMGEGLGLVDPQERFVFANPAAEEIFGVPRGSLEGRTLKEFMSAVSYQRMVEETRLREHGARGTYEVEIRRPSGELRTLLVTATPSTEHTFQGTFGVFRDITDRKRAEDALSESERWLRLSQGIARLGHYLFEVGGNTWSSSPALDEIFGIGPDYRRDADGWLALAHPDERTSLQAYLREVLASGTRFDREYRLVPRADGVVPWVHSLGELLRAADGSPVRLVGTTQDITARRQVASARDELAGHLRQSQKMEAIGSLAGGVAHDFNNLLSVILSYAGFALESVSPDQPLWEDLNEVRKAAERATALTRQLLAFSRKQVLQPVRLSVNQVAAEAQKMLQRLIGEDIEYQQVLAPDLWVVCADPAQVEQVLLNLVVNARDAMPHGGRLSISTSNQVLDDAAEAKRLGLAVGQYVQLTVTDSGTGMDAPTLARLFEPFFTTKERGKGTGLGLSTVYGIVTQSGGAISVSSAPGKGASFKVFLPRDASAAVPDARTPVNSLTATGTETILVVEDEDALRKSTTRTLERAGYKVLAANGVTQAVALVGAYPAEIHLLLTDVVMPQASGKALSLELLSVRPNLKVLFTSGYTDEVIARHGVLDAGIQFLPKPFRAGELRAKVRQVLDLAPAP